MTFLIHSETSPITFVFLRFLFDSSEVNRGLSAYLPAIITFFCRCHAFHGKRGYFMPCIPLLPCIAKILLMGFKPYVRKNPSGLSPKPTEESVNWLILLESLSVVSLPRDRGMLKFTKKCCKAALLFEWKYYELGDYCENILGFMVFYDPLYTFYAFF